MLFIEVTRTTDDQVMLVNLMHVKRVLKKEGGIGVLQVEDNYIGTKETYEELINRIRLLKFCSVARLKK